MRKILGRVAVFSLLVMGGLFMADLLKPTDTLAQGYPKINAAIGQAEQALNTAKQAGETSQSAVDTANKALAKSENTQEQLNQAIIQGDSSVEAAQARVDSDGFAFGNLKERLDNSDSQLADIVKLDEEVELGEELLDSTGWTSAGWTGDFNTGFTHTVGQITPLRRAVPIEAGKMYQVQLRLTPTCVLDGGNGTSDFSITIGGSEVFVTYQGYASTKLYSYGIIAPNVGDLIITPEPRYEGIITDISVREIVGVLEPSLQIKDANGNNAFEIRPTKTELKNVYIGKNVGRYNTSGNQNAIIGDNAFESNTSGFWNSAIGHMALQKNQMGSRNVAIGYTSLQNNISGHRNIAIGTFTLRANTHGANNIAIGADSLWTNTIGEKNIGIGLASLSENVSGSNNIALGTASMAENISGGNNVALGNWALTSSTTGINNIAIGNQALIYSIYGGGNIALGNEALKANTSGGDNVGIGQFTLHKNTTGRENVAIGYNSGFGSADGVLTRNVMIGYNTGSSMANGANYNTILGAASGTTITTGTNNILIGYNCNTPDATNSHKLNIGNAIYGDLTSNHRIGIGVTAPTAHMHIKAGSSGAGLAPLKIDGGSLLTTPETGAIEFDGVNLYITIASVRKTIQVA